ncbi:MAG: hypothetical protein KKA79_08590 [Nanoarchaeota archaeon]|nr:hypothetical protein [Nanoarchaeota archaeon]MCG2717977.1 hypothetical protein [Nanoarchaeota archaeon]
MNEFFNECYEFHYNLKKEKAVRTASKYEELKGKLDEGLKTKQINELRIVLHLKAIQSYAIQIIEFQLIYIKNFE